MKKIISLIFITFLFFNLFAQTYKGNQAQSIIPGTEVISYKQGCEIPYFIKFQEGNEIDFASLNLWITSTFARLYESGFDNKITFTLINTEKDQHGESHYRYQMLYDGIAISDGIFLVHVKNSKIVSINGIIINHVSLSNSISLAETDALQLALNSVNAQIYMWQSAGDEKWLKTFKKDANSTYYPKGKLVLLKKGSKYY